MMSPNRRGQNLLPPPMKTRKYAMKPSEWLPYQILGGKIDKNVQIEPQTVNKVGIPWPKQAQLIILYSKDFKT